MTAIDTGSIADLYTAEGFGLGHLPYASFTAPGTGFLSSPWPAPSSGPI